MDTKSLLISLNAPKIGFFDSGIGGLSILKPCLNLKAQELVYFADNKYLPYGNKSPEFLIERGKIITEYFLSQGINTIVVACHTSSATSLEKLKELFPQVTYIDMLAPTIDMAIKETKSGRIGVLATLASIESHTHKKLLIAQNSSLKIVEQACPDFVPLIECNAPEQELKNTIQHYIKPLLKQNVDTIILGCTHYAFLKDLIKKEAPNCTLISAQGYLETFLNKKTKSAPKVRFVSNSAMELPTAWNHIKDNKNIITV